MNEALAAELAAMAAEDQRMRELLADAGFESRPSIEQMMELTRIDVSNSDRLRAILDEHGWPGRSLVGEDGAENAWLLAQHADHQLDLQRRALELLHAAVAAGEATPNHLAYLTDRVRMNEGRPQLYGTQLAGVDDNGGVAWPVEDEQRLDERRAEVELESFAEYARSFLEASGERTTVGE